MVLRAVVELVLASSLGVAPLGAVLWTGLVVDVALGALILVGSARAIAIALLRVGFGMLVVLLVAIGARVISLALVDALGSAAVLAALGGVPGPARRRAAVALFVAHVLGVVVFLAAWRAPADGLGAEVTVLEGSGLPYRISFPSNGWRMRDAELVRVEAPDALAWLVRPDVGGNVMVAARLGADPSTTDLDEVEQRVLSELGETNVEVLSREPLGSGRLVRMRAQFGGIDGYAVVALHLVPGVEYRVLGSVDMRNTSSELESELEAIVRSFEPGQ
ncbi:hypothetical protein [Sandaracinus amylolyticus]|uniref:Transmembrane protein n=1 Tax=Sandaracinus amylolyticus TaxID=927083 RepID=A0A0F6W0G9_9BACT|nr:hypothetical protein [Sandaracinus amylolyticus]AKF04280.1 hypothetical protein DB32_001429 [Sandaracinus amylolyticus]